MKAAIVKHGGRVFREYRTLSEARAELFSLWCHAHPEASLKEDRQAKRDIRDMQAVEVTCYGKSFVAYAVSAKEIENENED